MASEQWEEFLTTDLTDLTDLRIYGFTDFDFFMSEENGMRPLWMTGGEKNDWREDFAHENGQYFNRCSACDEDFIGHKRRHICRKCYYESKARYEAMTDSERAAFDEFVQKEIEEFYKLKS